jgi:hypothetical protein
LYWSVTKFPFVVEVYPLTVVEPGLRLSMMK